ncbi:MAG: cytochrome c3 family protein [Deferrisomatales bacterium]
MKANPRRPWSWVLALTAGALLAAPGARAWESEDCMECHGDVTIVEEGGGYLYVDPARYARTAHAEEGCPSCHDAVSEDHPDDGVRPPRAQCGDCHEEVEAEYAASVHGDNASCTDCHNPHEVKGVTATSGVEMNRACTGCHESADVVDSHGTWLLQPELHIAALPCVTCHTASESYVITFYIQKVEPRSGRTPRITLAGLEELAGWARTRSPARLVDRDEDGEISIAELRRFHKEASERGLQLWGMMTPEKASHRFDTLDNRWDCTFCHASGPEAMQTSYVAFPDGHGGYERVPVERGAILEAVYGTPDFYLVGATRSRTLSAVGLAIVAAGLLMPLGHGTLRLLTIRNRKKEG